MFQQAYTLHKESDKVLNKALGNLEETKNTGIDTRERLIKQREKFQNNLGIVVGA